MFRGTTARTVMALLAAVLLCLPFFSRTVSFASAYTPRDVQANAEPGNGLPGKALRGEVITHGTWDHPGDPIGSLPTRDRYRPADSGHQAPERQLPEGDPAAAHQPITPVVAHPHTARSQAHTRAMLQVFRC